MTESQLLLLKDIFSENPEKISLNPEDLIKHTNSSFGLSDILAEAVFYPTSSEDVIKMVDFCIQQRITIIPYGAGTSVEGHVTATSGCIYIDFNRMNSILEVNTDDGYVIVEPGLSYNSLNAALKDTGFHFAVEACYGASLGGMAATNASGAGGSFVGSMRKNVLSCEVVGYQDEKAVKIDSKIVTSKSSAGYDLSSLMIGSEGTLGIITKLVLKVERNFDCSHTILCQFDDINSAIQFAINFKGKILTFRRLELMDQLQTKVCKEYSSDILLTENIILAEKITLIMELGGDAEIIAIEERKIMNYFSQKIREGQLINTYSFSNLDPIGLRSTEAIWKMRKFAGKAAIELLGGPDKIAMATDAIVLLSTLEACLNDCYSAMSELDIKFPLIVHLNDANFHFTVLYNPVNAEELLKAKEFGKKVVQIALNHRGVCTGEHGIGSGKLEYLPLQYDLHYLTEMANIKKIIDPLNIFNPEKTVPLELVNEKLLANKSKKKEEVKVLSTNFWLSNITRKSDTPVRRHSFCI